MSCNEVLSYCEAQLTKQRQLLWPSRVEAVVEVALLPVTVDCKLVVTINII